MFLRSLLPNKPRATSIHRMFVKNKSDYSNLLVRHSRVPFTVEPVLDFSGRLENLDSLAEELSARNIFASSEELASLKKDYLEWKTLTTELELLDERMGAEEDNCQLVPVRSALSNKIKPLLPSVRRCLDLPNFISAETPRLENRLIKTIKNDSESGNKEVSHVDVLGGMISFKTDPSACYLEGEVCEVLQNLQEYFRRRFMEAKMIQVGVPHIVRMGVAEGCCLGSPEMEVTCTEEEDASSPLQLVGNSLPGYAALFCRKVLTTAPVSLFSFGTSYREPKMRISQNDGLYGTSQYPCLTAFLMSDPSSIADLTSELESVICQIFEKLETTVVVEQVCAPSLNSAEASKLRFTLGNGQFTLGSMCTYSTFISERLRIYLKKGRNEQMFGHMVFAEINIGAVLAALIEAHCSNSSHLRNLLKICLS